jgi:DnaJ-class molecular chaperone
MPKLFWLALLALVAVLVVGSILSWTLSASRRAATASVATACITCHGRGYVTRSERTLEFDGGGFVDGDPSSNLCTACEGTGVIYR